MRKVEGRASRGAVGTVVRGGIVKSSGLSFEFMLTSLFMS